MQWQGSYNAIRNFLPRLIGKEVLIFLFFLAVSAAFWFLSSLNESYDQEFIVKLHVTDVPENVIITEDLPDSVRVTIHDKGFVLFNYMTSDIPAIAVKFSLYAQRNGKGSITQGEVAKILKARLSPTSSIVSIKSDRWDFYFNHGQRKRLPIVMGGTVETKANYFVTHTVFTPDSVTVYATREALDTISVAYTEAAEISDLASNITQNISLKGIPGAKIEPKEVSMSVFVDQLTEMVVNVPIRPVNAPDGISLKLFPARVDVRVAIGMKRTNGIKPEQFSVVADYEKLSQSASGKIPLSVVSQPKGVVKVSLKTDEVDYLMEGAE